MHTAKNFEQLAKDKNQQLQRKEKLKENQEFGLQEQIQSWISFEILIKIKGFAGKIPLSDI